MGFFKNFLIKYDHFSVFCFCLFVFNKRQLKHQSFKLHVVSECQCCDFHAEDTQGIHTTHLEALLGIAALGV